MSAMASPSVTSHCAAFPSNCRSRLPSFDLSSSSSSFRPHTFLRNRSHAFSNAFLVSAPNPRIPKLHLLHCARAQFADGEIHSPLNSSESYLTSDGEDNSTLPHFARTLPESARLYVGNLAWACTDEDLAEHFQGAGTVERVEVMYDRDTGRSRGFAFVTMDSIDAANVAVSRFDGVEFMGRRIRVSFPDRSRNEGSFSSSSSFSNYSSNVNKLFVGNLPWGMDDVTLENIFSEHGKVLEARVVYDRESGRSRGFGFVTLSSAEEVNEAISKLDGAEVQGRPLRVNLASDRPPSRQSFF